MTKQEAIKEIDKIFGVEQKIEKPTKKSTLIKKRIAKR